MKNKAFFAVVLATIVVIVVVLAGLTPSLVQRYNNYNSSASAAITTQNQQNSFGLCVMKIGERAYILYLADIPDLWVEGSETRSG